MTLTAMRLGGGVVEGARGAAVQRAPGVAVDFGLEGGLERLVGVVGAKEVGVPDKEALFVVVDVDEPAGDAVGVSLRISPVLGWDTSTPLTLSWICSLSVQFALRRDDLDVGLAEYDEQFPLAGVLRSPGMCRSAFMRALSTGIRPSLLNSEAHAISTSKSASMARAERIESITHFRLLVCVIVGVGLDLFDGRDRSRTSARSWLVVSVADGISL